MFVSEWPPVASDQCLFYHTMDLPKGEVVHGQWDMRGRIRDYTGKVNLSGKRVLDVGCASGFLSFEMEKLGASVVSFDAASASDIHFIPVPGHEYVEHRETWIINTNDYLVRLKNSYWYCHSKLNSKNVAFYGDVYHLPDELGTFDVCMVGQILVHLRDPISVLGSICRLSSDTIIITEGMQDAQEPLGYAYANAAQGGPPYIWWQLSKGWYRNFLDLYGFDIVSITDNSYLCVQHEYVTGEMRVPTIVARRRK